MIMESDSNPELERQRAAIEAAFSKGWRPVGGPRVLTDSASEEARKILDGQASWTGLDQAIIDAVRAGAQPGDPLPPPAVRPYIDNVDDTEVIITGNGPERRVAALFSRKHFPGVRFGHRFPLDPYGEDREQIWLKEEIETGALHRMMENHPSADGAGVIWTTWGSSAQ
jgi:hypothetical protein